MKDYKNFKESPLNNEDLNSVNKRFYSLLRGADHSLTRYGLQSSDSQYSRNNAVLTPDVVESHIKGEITFEVRPSEDGKSCFSAFDVDVKSENLQKGEPIAKDYRLCKLVTSKIIEILILLQLKFIVEWSGRRGFHIWLFWQHSQKHEDLRQLSQYVMSQIDLEKKEKEKIGIEIKPLHVGDGLRAPFGIHKANGKRSILLNHETFEPFDGNIVDFFSRVEVNGTEILKSLLQTIELRQEINKKSRKNPLNKDLSLKESLKPCVALSSVIDDLESDEKVGHLKRMALSVAVQATNWKDLEKQLIDIFSQRKDFSESVTLKAMEKLTFSNGPSCKKISEWTGKCEGSCPGIQGIKPQSPTSLFYEHTKKYKIDLPEGLILPSSYSISRDGVYEVIENKKGCYSLKITNTPMYITSVTRDHDTGEYGVVLIYFLGKGKKNQIKVKRDIISDSRKVIQLSLQGLDVNSINSNSIVKYLSEFIGNNELPIEMNFSKPGWYKIDNYLVYSLGKTLFSHREDLPTPCQSSYDIPGIRSKGDLQRWREIVNDIIDRRYIMFLIGFACAALLLPLLNVSNYIIHICGDSSKGKTITLRLLSSIFGVSTGPDEPESLIKSLRTTDNGLEGIAALHNHFPLFLDEAGQAHPEVLRKFIYMLGNGAGKSRAGRNGEGRMVKTWKNNVISTGEESLLQQTSRTGEEVRYFEIVHPPFYKDGESSENQKFTVEKVVKLIEKNCGLAGPIFIQQLIDIVNDNNCLKQLKERFEVIKNELKLKSNSTYHSRIADNFAAAQLAFEVFTKSIEVELDRHDIKSNFQSVYEEAGIKWSEGNTTTTIDQAIKYLWDVIAANPSSFHQDAYKKMGEIKKVSGYENSYCFIESELDRVLIEGRFDPKSIKRQLKQKKYVLLYPNGRLLKVKIGNSGKYRDTYIFNEKLVPFIFANSGEDDEACEDDDFIDPSKV